MIQRGANPHVLNYAGESQYNKNSLGSLSNLPEEESIFFQVKSFPSGNLISPFHYETGVYPGQFGRVIGKGGEGVVIEGKWNNEQAAFKFVTIRDQKVTGFAEDTLANMNARLREMIEMESINGSNIVKLNGHFT